MKRWKRTLLSLACVFALLGATASLHPLAKEYNTGGTDWMVGKYGIFLHYLRAMVAGGADFEKWNEVVNSFDVEAFARQAEEAGASWVCITLSQSDGYFCAPCKTMEDFTRTFNEEGERCGTDRDLPMDLYDALSKRGIKLMLYYVSGVPSGYPELAKAMGGKTRVGGDTGDFILNWTMVENNAAVMREFSDRYKDKVVGWWIDGCYESVGFNERVADAYAAALRNGNENALVALNRGTAYPDVRYACEDYTAGENINLLGDSFGSRWSDNKAQNHYLTYLGNNWGGSELKYDNDWFAEYSYRNVLSKGGCMTVDVHADGDGTIAQGQLEQLKTLKNYLKTQPPVEVIGAPEQEENPVSSQEPAPSQKPSVSSKPTVVVGPTTSETPSSEIPTEVIIEEDTASQTESEEVPAAVESAGFKAGWVAGIVVLGVELLGMIALIVLLILKQKKAKPFKPAAQI